MKKHFPHIGLKRLCRLFGKSRQAFYDHLNRNSDNQLQEAVVVDLVRSVRQYLPKIGGIKLHYMLKEDFHAHGITMGRDRFFRLLRSNNLLVKRKRKYAITTYSNHPYRKWKDLTKNLQLTAPDQLWVSDITYLRTTTRFIYLSLVTDAYSRKIVGYHLSQTLKAQGPLIAVGKAIAGLSGRPDNLIHHSDRGMQYCCEAYVATITRSGIGISMTESGSPYDNAIAERVNGILKSEFQLDQVFKNYHAAVSVIHGAVDAYNRLRPHLSCGKLTPEQAHTTEQKLQKFWKPKKYDKSKLVLVDSL